MSSKNGSCIESRSRNSSYVEGTRDVVIVIEGHCDVTIFSVALEGSVGRSASVADEAREISIASDVGLVEGDGERGWWWTEVEVQAILTAEVVVEVVGEEDIRVQGPE